MSMSRNCQKLDAMVERWTDKLHDEAFGPKEIECGWCKRMFLDNDDIYESVHDNGIVFCSDDCRDNWDENYEAEDYDCE